MNIGALNDRGFAGLDFTLRDAPASGEGSSDLDAILNVARTGSPVEQGEALRALDAGLGARRRTDAAVRQGDASPQNGLLDRARDAFCKVRSFEIGGEGASFLGAGIRYSGSVAYNTATGDVFLKGSFGGGIGLGGGSSSGLSAQSGSTQAGVRGSLDSRVALGAGVAGGDLSYNYQTIEGRNRLGSQGVSGSVGIAKEFGIGYASLLEATVSAAKKLGTLGTTCTRR